MNQKMMLCNTPPPLSGRGHWSYSLHLTLQPLLFLFLFSVSFFFLSFFSFFIFFSWTDTISICSSPELQKEICFHPSQIMSIKSFEYVFHKKWFQSFGNGRKSWVRFNFKTFCQTPSELMTREIIYLNRETCLILCQPAHAEDCKKKIQRMIVNWQRWR